MYAFRLLSIMICQLFVGTLLYGGVGGHWEVVNLCLGFKRLVEEGQLERAKDFGYRTMNYWLSEDRGYVKDGFKEKLDFAVLMGDEGSFNRLLKRLPWTERKLQKYGESKRLYFRMEKLRSEESDTIGELMNHIYLGREVLQLRWGGDRELAQKELRSILQELYNQKELGEILDGLAAYGKKNPYFRLNLFAKNPVGSGLAGMYFSYFMHVDVYMNDLRGGKDFRGILIHEWTHQLMDVLFKNEMRPYEDESREFGRIAAETTKRVGATKVRDTTYYNLLQVTKHPIYDELDRDMEYIVRYPETLARGDFRGQNARYLLGPLKGYWDTSVRMRIREYVNNS